MVFSIGLGYENNKNVFNILYIEYESRKHD